MDIIYWGNFILIPIAILELILGLYILSRRPRSAVSVSFAIFCFSVALWVFSNGFGYVLESPDSFKVFWWYLTFPSASLIASVFLYFSWVFPYKSKEIRLREYLAVIIPTVVFSLVIAFSDIFIKGIDFNLNPPPFIFGPFYHVFAIYFLFFWIGALINLIIKYKKSDGIHRWQLKYLLIGVFLSSIFGMGTNLLLPYFFHLKTLSYDFIGPGSSIIWLGMVSYIIWKK
ncbi:MAG: histidine kinase N-terminal 7TM domain-containing protein [Patescibacteria group bacterium]